MDINKIMGKLDGISEMSPLVLLKARIFSQLTNYLVVAFCVSVQFD